MTVAMDLSLFHNPFPDLVFPHSDLKSFFCLIVFSIVGLVLAYLTNPSETSFRAYLTEQSFRLHLSRLDDSPDDHLASQHRYRSSPIDSAHPPFHFANRASISLRTPKHVFYSFAVFTVAALHPLSKATATTNPRDARLISDSWYIGAFGKWWRGGMLEEWYQDIITSVKDEESWSSGILNIKRLDMLQDYNPPTFSAKNLPAHLQRGSPPKLRNRERPSLRNANGSLQPRTSSPPPLPKSVSLPMHTVRKSASNNANSTARVAQLPHATQPCITNPASAGLATNSITRRVSSNGPRSLPSSTPASTSLDQSPLIAEILRQISASRASVLDLRTQLSECQTTATQSRAVLQHELDTHRDRKRQEDASKAELKLQTKTLDDSKRSAEALKKAADKKLKALQSVRDNATERAEFLDNAISNHKGELSQNREFIENRRQQQTLDAERDIAAAIEQKRLEIKAAEDDVLVLNQRSRELEDQLASGKETLEIIRGKSEQYKQRRLLPPAESQQLQHQQQSLHQLQLQQAWVSGPVFDGQTATVQAGDRWDMASGLLNARDQVAPGYGFPRDTGSYVEDSANVVNFGNSSFVPFADNAHIPTLNGHTMVDSPISASHPYFSYGQDYSGDVSASARFTRALQTNMDAYVDKDRRFIQHTPAQYNAYADDSFHGQVQPLRSPVSLHGSSAHKHNSEEAPIIYELQAQVSESPMHSPWSHVTPSRSGKGLNPDAKEFNLFARSNTGFLNSTNTTIQASMPHSPGQDPLAPANGLPTSSSSQSFLRAFAPSPAEREALRALAVGGASNGSFELLPSLSEVPGSIPASPTQVHASHIASIHNPSSTLGIGAHTLAHARVSPTNVPPPPPASARDLSSVLPAWLQALPKTRKVNFSPWDDEDVDQPKAK